MDITVYKEHIQPCTLIKYLVLYLDVHPVLLPDGGRMSLRGN